MDKIEPGKDTPEEVTRESLIAISYSVPDKTLASKLLSENLESKKLVKVDCDEADNYRWELLSISNSPSLDIQGLPVTIS
ncbi:conserved hypothetical protein [Ricinus communis]|uniref:Uncharacterized protein n=1 Tax=Ricinus communis TaxID=3988 RepID=B9SKJ3_RICCO|nr:conserved hypothetical protein [Ricinus communis]